MRKSLILVFFFNMTLYGQKIPFAYFESKGGGEYIDSKIKWIDTLSLKVDEIKKKLSLNKYQYFLVNSDSLLIIDEEEICMYYMSSKKNIIRFSITDLNIKLLYAGLDFYKKEIFFIGNKRSDGLFYIYKYSLISNKIMSFYNIKLETTFSEESAVSLISYLDNEKLLIDLDCDFLCKISMNDYQPIKIQKIEKPVSFCQNLESKDCFISINFLLDIGFFVSTFDKKSEKQKVVYKSSNKPNLYESFRVFSSINSSDFVIQDKNKFFLSSKNGLKELKIFGVKKILAYMENKIVYETLDNNLKIYSYSSYSAQNQK